jgi:hypothetical protein
MQTGLCGDLLNLYGGEQANNIFTAQLAAGLRARVICRQGLNSKL